MNDGMLFAWSSPFIVKITNDNVTYSITENEASYFAIIPTASMMIACILFASLCDIIGRKATFLLISIPGILAWILKALATDITLFYVSRMLAGLDTGCFFASLPMYAGEISSPKIRGVVGSLVTSLNFFGQFLINVLGNFFDVPTTSYICLPIPIIFLCLSYFMPESPYYYIMKGKHEEAKKSLSRLRRKQNIEEDFLKLKDDVERQMSERGTWRDLIMILSNRKAVLIGAFLRASQLMGGTMLFVTSAQFIFDKASSSISPGISAILYSFFTFLGLFISGLFIEKMGRRVAYTSSLILTSIVLLLESLYFFLDQNLQKDVSAFNWFPLVGMIVFIILVSFGPGIIPTIMISEIFSTSVKAKANIVMVFLVAFISTVMSTIFYQMYPVTGLSGPYLLFGLTNIVSAIISYFYLPETKGKTLEEIQQMLKGNT